MDMVVHFAYGIMIVGIIFCFVFSKNHLRDLRKASTQFAFAFVKLSNYVSPSPPKSGLLAEENGDEVRLLPVQQQPEAIRNMIRRAGNPHAVELFQELDAAAEKVAKRVGFNRTHKAQFLEPVDGMLLLTHSFLIGCENLEQVRTKEQKAAMDSFLLEQPKHRMLLLKRITGDMADGYREMNKAYAGEMEQIENEEMEARMRRKKGKPEKGPVEKGEAASPKEAPVEERVSESCEQPKAQTADGEENLHDKWKGWGCG